MSNLIDQDRSARQAPCPDNADSIAGFDAAGRLELPLAADSVERPSAELLEAADLANANVLSFLLQEIEGEARRRPLDDAVSEAIAPLQVKLDMVIAMLAQLSFGGVELPPRRPLELTPGRIVWLAPQPAQVGEWLRLRIYFHAVFRDPVVLFGRVASCHAMAGEEYATTAELAGVAGHIGSDLARLAYLAHRRQQARRPAERRAR